MNNNYNSILPNGIDLQIGELRYQNSKSESHESQINELPES